MRYGYHPYFQSFIARDRERAEDEARRDIRRSECLASKLANSRTIPDQAVSPTRTA